MGVCLSWSLNQGAADYRGSFGLVGTGTEPRHSLSAPVFATTAGLDLWAVLERGCNIFGIIWPSWVDRDQM